MTDDPTDDDVVRAVDSLVGSERALRAALRGLDPGRVDPSAPSRLPDWTVGHVMTHLARNADSVLSVLDGAPQYPQGREGRNADIEAGSTRSWQALVDDVIATSEAVERRVTERDDWSGTAHMIGGDRPMAMVPILRQREVEVHAVDLGLGHEFVDMPADYVRRDLRLMEMLWAARAPMGMTPLPDAVLEVSPPERLSWMMGRSEIDGIGPADLF